MAESRVRRVSGAIWNHKEIAILIIVIMASQYRNLCAYDNRLCRAAALFGHGILRLAAVLTKIQVVINVIITLISALWHHAISRAVMDLAHWLVEPIPAERDVKFRGTVVLFGRHVVPLRSYAYWAERASVGVSVGIYIALVYYLMRATLPWAGKVVRRVWFNATLRWKLGATNFHTLYSPEADHAGTGGRNKRKRQGQIAGMVYIDQARTATFCVARRSRIGRCFIVTAAHCYDSSATFHGPNSSIDARHLGKPSLVSGSLDLVCLRIPEELAQELGLKILQWTSLSWTQPVLLVTATSAGNMQSLAPVSKMEKSTIPFAFHHNAATHPGDSGAPLVTGNGHLVAIHLGSDNRAKLNVALAVFHPLSTLTGRGYRAESSERNDDFQVDWAVVRTQLAKRAAAHVRIGDALVQFWLAEDGAITANWADYEDDDESDEIAYHQLQSVLDSWTDNDFALAFEAKYDLTVGSEFKMGDIREDGGLTWIGRSKGRPTRVYKPIPSPLKGQGINPDLEEMVRALSYPANGKEKARMSLEHDMTRLYPYLKRQFAFVDQIDDFASSAQFLALVARMPKFPVYDLVKLRDCYLEAAISSLKDSNSVSYHMQARGCKDIGDAKEDPEFRRMAGSVYDILVDKARKSMARWDLTTLGVSECTKYGVNRMLEFVRGREIVEDVTHTGLTLICVKSEAVPEAKASTRPRLFQPLPVAPTVTHRALDSPQKTADKAASCTAPVAASLNPTAEFNADLRRAMQEQTYQLGDDTTFMSCDCSSFDKQHTVVWQVIQWISTALLATGSDDDVLFFMAVQLEMLLDCAFNPFSLPDGEVGYPTYGWMPSGHYSTSSRNGRTRVLMYAACCWKLEEDLGFVIAGGDDCLESHQTDVESVLQTYRDLGILVKDDYQEFQIDGNFDFCGHVYEVGRAPYLRGIGKMLHRFIAMLRQSETQQDLMFEGIRLKVAGHPMEDDVLHYMRRYLGSARKAARRTRNKAHKSRITISAGKTEVGRREKEVSSSSDATTRMEEA